MKTSMSNTLWPEICSVGQIWTTVWPVYHQTESKSMHMIEDYFARNMFCRSNVDFCMGEENQSGVNECV